MVDPTAFSVAYFCAIVKGETRIWRQGNGVRRKFLLIYPLSFGLLAWGILLGFNGRKAKYLFHSFLAAKYSHVIWDWPIRWPLLAWDQHQNREAEKTSHCSCGQWPHPVSRGTARTTGSIAESSVRYPVLMSVGRAESPRAPSWANVVLKSPAQWCGLAPLLWTSFLACC